MKHNKNQHCCYPNHSLSIWALFIYHWQKGVRISEGELKKLTINRYPLPPDSWGRSLWKNTTVTGPLVSFSGCVAETIVPGMGFCRASIWTLLILRFSIPLMTAGVKISSSITVKFASYLLVFLSKTVKQEPWTLSLVGLASVKTKTSSDKIFRYFRIKEFYKN